MSRQGLVEFIQGEVLAARYRATPALNGAKLGWSWGVGGSCGPDREIELERLAYQCRAASMFDLPGRFELFQHLAWKRDRHGRASIHFLLVLRQSASMSERQR